MKILPVIISGLLILSSVAYAANPAGIANDIQIKKDATNFSALTADTDAAYKAHTTVSAGTAFDPRDPTYGAVCGGVTLATGNGSTTVFNSTIKFRGSSSTDTSQMMVWYEPTNGFGTATFPSFTVTGVNSGNGVVVTFASPPPAGNSIIIAHDDSAGFVAASTAAVAKGGYVVVPDGCSIYGSQANGTQLAEGAELIGQGFSQNYGYQGQGIKPILHVLAPGGSVPNYGFNISGKNQQFFEGFTITSNIPGNDSLGFLQVPVLIGSNTSAGAGGGQSPGIVAQYMTFNSGKVGFGAPIGGSSGYIFSVVRFSNFTANNAGMFGPFSDLQLVGSNFSSNGAFGTYGSAGGAVIGPTQAAAGAAGASRFLSNRFEFNSEGLVIKQGYLISMVDNQFDSNGWCGLAFNNNWGQINVTGGWFRANGRSNGSGSGTSGNTTPGKDAHVCITGSGTGNGGLSFDNVNFLNGYARGYTNPIGTSNANTPAYVLDMTAAGADNDNISFTGGSAYSSPVASAGYVQDFSIFRNNQPANYKVNTDGQSTIGGLIEGAFTALIKGIASSVWNSYYAYGDDVTYDSFAVASEEYPYLINSDLHGGLTNEVVPQGFDCDVVDQKIFPTSNPGLVGNPLVSWLPAVADPTYGAPGSGAPNAAHLAITNSCHLAGLTWMTIPISNKILGQATGCVKTGTWSNSSQYGGAYGTVSNTNGDTVACTISSNGGPVYFWYGLKENDGGTFTYSIDGGTATTLPTNGGNAFSFPVATHTSVAGVRLPVLTQGSHTVTFTVTSSTNVANTVTVYGLGTPPGKAYLGGNPQVFFGGQIYELNDALALSTSTYNLAHRSLASQLKADGLGVNFADVRKYINSTTDMTGGVDAETPNAAGKQKLAQAFEGVMQFIPNSKNAPIDPRDYGAACNAQQFANTFSSPNNAVNTTSGSDWITINNYTFKDGVATQTGGGDVGKVISIFANSSNTVGHTTYIKAVDTALNRAQIGVLAESTQTNAFAVMGGYPTNSADPSTAVDDTIYIQNASAAAVAAGVPLSAPNNCLIHNLSLASHTQLQGATGGLLYGDLAPSHMPPSTWYIASNGLGSDPHFGINLVTSKYVTIRDMRIQCTNFPYLGYAGQTLAGIGAETDMALDPGSVMIENVSFSLCPVNFGVPYGMNQPVTFTASQSGTTMTVTSIDSTQFSTYYGLQSGGVPVTVDDWLANGRKIQQASFTASQSGNTMTVTAVASGTIAVGQAIQAGGTVGATITALGTGTGGTGTYTLSNSATVGSTNAWRSGTSIVSSPTAGRTGDYTVANSITLASQSLTSPANGVFLTGRLENNQFYNGGINVNGDFSDLDARGNIHTGGFLKCMWLGPSTSSPGNAANRFALERYEVCNNGAIVIDGASGKTGALQFTGEHFQINSGYAVETRGTVNDVIFTGGTFQGNASSTANAPIRAQVALGGNTTNFSVDGAEWLKDLGGGCGACSNYLIGTVTGFTGDYISITGGDGRSGYNVSPYNFAAATPTHFKMVIPGINSIDTTQSTLSMPTTGGVAIGTATSTATAGQLDVGKAGTTQGSILLNGATSGTATFTTAAAAGTTTIKVPTSNGTNGYFLTTDGAGQWSWVTPPISNNHITGASIIGNAVVANDIAPWIREPGTGTNLAAQAVCKTAPTGQPMIFDILKSSNYGVSFTSIWNSTPANRLQVAAGVNNGSQTSFDTAGFSANDIFRYDVVQIGSGAPGADCTVQLLQSY